MFQIYFYPYLNEENDTDGFQAQLINDTEIDYLYDITYSSNRQTPQRFTSQILSFGDKKLNYLKFDHLNESPIYNVMLWEKLSTGTGPSEAYVLKIKAKSFFKYKYVDSYTSQTYYKLDLEPAKAKEKKDSASLKKYTLSAKANQPKQSAANNVIVNVDILNKANFNTSIDLHIEQLVGDPGKMNTFEKLQYQIFKAKEYLEEAYMLGIDRVYLLHGVGKGRLKDDLASMLKADPTVASFKNEYHGQFGYGATEVIFK